MNTTVGGCLHLVNNFICTEGKYQNYPCPYRSNINKCPCSIEITEKMVEQWKEKGYVAVASSEMKYNPLEPIGISMLDKRIKFEESYVSEEYGTITLYFTAPKEMLNGKYPEAESMEISIECPSERTSARYASVMFSPTKYDEESESHTDYDWFDVDMSYEEIEALIELAKRSGKI